MASYIWVNPWLQIAPWFTAMFDGVLLFSMLLATGDHATLNPLFQELHSQGFALTRDSRLKLPSPALADGRDDAAQQAALVKIIGGRYPVSEFARNSVVAPFVFKFPDIRREEVAARGVDVWFIVHGDLDDLSKDEVLREFTSVRGKANKLHFLTAAELEARKLPAASADNAKTLTSAGETIERFVHSVATVLDHVELHQTLRCVLSRSEDSIVIGMIVDQRFDSDKDFPNQYRRLLRSDTGERTKGTPQPYAGAGGYLKATRLAQPKGAIFVEYHSIYSEPQDWFNGANLLQSKLPLLIQSRVRELRRDVRK
jgi:hypothetical protein